MKQPLVSVTVLGFNGVRVLGNCLSSLMKQTYANLEVILVDNGSKDNTVEFVKKKFPSVKIIATGENLGVCEGFNVGFRAAKGMYVVVLGQDTTCPKNLIEEMARAIESDKKIGIVGCGEYPIDADVNDTSKLVKVGEDCGFLGISTNSKILMRCERFTPNGSCFMVRKSAFTHLFDKDYFMYGEEDYIALNCWLKGWKVIYEPRARYRHVGGHSTQHYRKGGMFNAERNSLMNYFRFYSGRTLLLTFPLLVFVIFARFSRMLLALQGREMKESLTAWFWLLWNWRTILQKRKETQKGKIVSDKVVLKFFLESKGKTTGKFNNILFPAYRAYLRAVFPFLK